MALKKPLVVSHFRYVYREVFQLGALDSLCKLEGRAQDTEPPVFFNYL